MHSLSSSTRSEAWFVTWWHYHSDSFSVSPSHMGLVKAPGSTGAVIGVDALWRSSRQSRRVSPAPVLLFEVESNLFLYWEDYEDKKKPATRAFLLRLLKRLICYLLLAEELAGKTSKNKKTVWLP